MSLPITTRRLIIRPFTAADFEAIHAVWSDPEVMGPIPSKPYDRDKSWARLTEKFSHQAQHGFSKWAVVDKADGKVIGECGVHYLEGGPDIELGYKLSPRYWGQGLAAEAAQACLDWALAERPERVVAIVDPANTPSARVLDKIGMVREGTFSRLNHEWDFYIAIRRQATADGTEVRQPGRLPEPAPTRTGLLMMAGSGVPSNLRPPTPATSPAQSAHAALAGARPPNTATDTISAAGKT